MEEASVDDTGNFQQTVREIRQALGALRVAVGRLSLHHTVNHEAAQEIQIALAHANRAEDILQWQAAAAAAATAASASAAEIPPATTRPQDNEIPPDHAKSAEQEASRTSVEEQEVEEEDEVSLKLSTGRILHVRRRTMPPYSAWMRFVEARSPLSLHQIEEEQWVTRLRTAGLTPTLVMRARYSYLTLHGGTNGSSHASPQEAVEV